MAGAAFEAHSERARDAQRLSDLARELAGAERELAERSERLMGEETSPALTDLHRRLAMLHRQALEQYERTAELQLLQAEHERHAAHRADATGSFGGDAVAREATADAREAAADERDHLANIRDQVADERDRRAEGREELQEERERHLEQVPGRAGAAGPPGERDPFARARTVLRRMEARLTRDEAALDREDALTDRDQATIDRESATTARIEPLPGDPSTDVPPDA